MKTRFMMAVTLVSVFFLLTCVAARAQNLYCPHPPGVSTAGASLGCSNIPGGPVPALSLSDVVASSCPCSIEFSLQNWSGSPGTGVLIAVSGALNPVGVPVPGAAAGCLWEVPFGTNVFAALPAGGYCDGVPWFGFLPGQLPIGLTFYAQATLFNGATSAIEGVTNSIQVVVL